MFHPDVSPVGGSLFATAIVAALPLLVLMGLLGVAKMRSDLASLCAVVVCLITAVFAFHMPGGQALSGALEGAAFGIFPIVWIVVNAVWINRLVQESGNTEVLKRSFMALSRDYRIQALVIAFCFGSMLESMAGFGAPIAVVASILVSLGFPLMRAALVAMFADAASTAFGSVGNPVLALSKTTGFSPDVLGDMLGRQSAIVAVFVPFVLLFVLDGKRGLKELWPVGLTAGVGFSLGQFLTSNFIAFQLSDLLGAVLSAIMVLVLLRLWSPRTVIAAHGAEPQQPPAEIIAGAADDTAMSTAGTPTAVRHDPPWVIAKAFSPYALLTVLLIIVSLDNPVQRWVGKFGATFKWPGLHLVNGKGIQPSTVIFQFDWLSATGTVLLVTGAISAIILAVPAARAAACYGGAIMQIRRAAATVALVMALAYVLNYSGQAVALGHWIAGAGVVFAFLSPVLGWLGVAATGSDTSANAIFGAVQVTAANRIGISPVVLAAANSEAGALGKLISPQNLAMAAAAVGMSGREGHLLRRTIGWSLIFLVGFCIVVAAMAGVLG